LTSRYIDATAINRQFRIPHDTKDNRAANTADCRSFLLRKQERLLAGRQAPRTAAGNDVPAVARIFGFAPWVNTFAPRLRLLSAGFLHRFYLEEND